MGNRIECPSEAWDRYCEQQERAAEGATLDELVRELGERSGRRNRECWPVLSFGGKDADLEAEGCTGISELRPAEEAVEVHFGGHKTVVAGDCLETDDEAKERSFNEQSQELVCGCGFDGEWGGDEWVVSFSGVVKVPWVMDEELGEEDLPATAEAIVKRVNEECASFRKEMAYISQVQDEMYKELSDDA